MSDIPPHSLARDGESLSPAAVAAILKEEGFSVKLPRRRDEERPNQPRPITADVADVRQLDLAPRTLHTKFGGLFLFLPDLVAADLDRVLRCGSGFPGSSMIPAACAMRSLLAFKLFGTGRHRNVMSYVLDEGLALFAGLNAIPKRSFLTEYSCRIAPTCYPRLMRRHWFDRVSRLGLRWGTSFDLDFHTIPFHGEDRWLRSTTSPSGAGARRECSGVPGPGRRDTCLLLCQRPSLRKGRAG